MTVYAAAISLLQNNCTFLNEQLQSRTDNKTNPIASELVPQPDFCNITNFTPDNLAFAIKFVNFTGYTGQIWFSDGYLKRAIESYFLFNPTTDLLSAPMVGILNISGAYINDSALTFVDGVVPCSSKIDQCLPILITFL